MIIQNNFLQVAVWVTHKISSTRNFHSKYIGDISLAGGDAARRENREQTRRKD